MTPTQEFWAWMAFFALFMIISLGAGNSLAAFVCFAILVWLGFRKVKEKP